ncbi:ATP-binding protein [Lichenibacterium dinghuense]|uniref:ATP-binding protein n=1 Tax=Lichenibacterium dinghuense TaxID=2895977 RepID=UPI001F38E404|nr:ATP-binding protein [Lichenibacterium sp. 6Y81]
MLDGSWLLAGGSLALASLAVADRLRLGRRLNGAPAGRAAAAAAGPAARASMEEALEARRRAEAASEAKSRFLATVSHEVRTPLNGILGIADLLADTPLTREQLAYVEAVRTSGSALATLIDEILDFSRIEAGKLEIAAEPFDLATLVEGVVELLAPRAQDRGLEIAAFVSADLPRVAVGDPVRLRQVLTNLAGNAVKFTAKGGVGLTVEPAGEGRVRFAVSDTGPGVPADRREAIFHEFEQADGTTTRRHGGTGLGLAISRRIVALMGGHLALEDRSGGGSVFAFAVGLDTRPAVGSSPAPDMRGQTVLIAAASPFQAPYLADTLDRYGANVALADRVERALAWLSGGNVPDVLVVDCGLGEAAAERLAEAARSAGVKRSFLLFSPYERRAFGQKLVAGYEGWLVKPVRAASLASRLAGAAPAEARRPARPAPSPRPGRRGLRVLLAEDNEINTLVAMNFLGRLGAQVVHASDGGSALALATAAMRDEIPSFDAIVMDVSMPVLDGLEVTRRIRQAEAAEDRPAVRIVALTAHAFREDHDRCLAAGMDAVTTKPLELARLDAALRPAGAARPGLQAAG